jgi:hypothetical protein
LCVTTFRPRQRAMPAICIVKGQTGELLPEQGDQSQVGGLP